MSELSKRIADLSPEKRALLIQQLAKKKGSSQPTGIARQSRESNRLPLSFAQQRLWFLEQLNPGTALYNVSVALQLTGRLDTAALEQSFSAIVSRHEVLRTTFAAEGGTPFQVIGDSQAHKLPIIDLRSLPEPAREAHARDLARNEAAQPFDLVNGPLLRTTLLRLDDTRHVLLLTIHHIAFDGWSLGLFMHELGTFYRAYLKAGSAVRAESVDLPELPIQYADFAAWQREWLQGKVLDQHLEYWTQQLAGAPAVLTLPTDRPRPATQTFSGAACPFTLPLSLSAELRTLSNQQGTTLFMTLLAGFQIVLAQYSGQLDIVVGSPVAGRSRTELEGLIGFFVNTLALRSSLANNPTVQELLRQVRDVCLGAYAHQELPFERLVEELRVERNLSHTPVFQVMFDLHNMKSEPLTLPDLAIEWWAEDSGAGKFDLLLALDDSAPALHGVIEYNADLFNAATIARMVEHFTNVLAAMAGDPARRVSDIAMLSAAERHELLVVRNATHDAFPPDTSFIQLFERQAARTPNAPAVVSGDRRLTYRELDRSANRLAQYLRQRGVGPDAVVGLYLERSADLVVGLLGILKAGGAYLPIDPAAPLDRIQFMLQDTRAALLLTEQRLAAALEAPGVEIVCLDTDWARIELAPDAAPLSAGQPESLAYIIFTSGSTGRSKGVAVEHRQLAHYVLGIQKKIQFPEGAQYALVSTFAADLGHTSTYTALSTGGCLHILSAEQAADPQTFAAYASRHQIDCLKLVPSHLAALLSAVAPEQALPRQRLILGGETLSWDLLNTARQLAPHCQIFNHYGPTETTVGAIAYHASQAERADGAASVPLGAPLSNSRVYILNRYGQPVPGGVPGEIVIGGGGVARGYLNRPDLTAEKFVPDPFSATPGARAYRTGDVGRYLPDGTIEFIGRIDDQVKIRGYRVEPGEVAAIIRQHPAVSDAVVLAREDAPGDRRLVAYVVATGPHPPAPAPSGYPTSAGDGESDGDSPSPAGAGEGVMRSIGGEGLRAFLASRLPDYMVPSAFVFLESLPLTPNGKLDRHALPAPENEYADRSDAVVAPRTPAEQTIAGIWADVLRIDQVSIYDNFFALGGHSLLAIQILSRLRDALQVDLPLRTLFEHPTIVDLAAAAQVQQQPADDPILSVSGGREEQLLENLDQLSDLDIDSLLSDMLASGEAAE